MSENSKGSPPFYIFRHCDTVQKSHFKIFLGNFFQSLKGPPFNFFFIFCNQLEFHKAQRVPFYIFRHCDTVQKSHFKIFLGNFFQSLKGPPSIFFIFCHQLEFHKTQRVPPFTILSLRYSADFGRSRLVCFFDDFLLKTPKSPPSIFFEILQQNGC